MRRHESFALFLSIYADAWTHVLARSPPDRSGAGCAGCDEALMPALRPACAAYLCGTDIACMLVAWDGELRWKILARPTCRIRRGNSRPRGNDRDNHRHRHPAHRAVRRPLGDRGRPAPAHRSAGSPEVANAGTAEGAGDERRCFGNTRRCSRVAARWDGVCGAACACERRIDSPDQTGRPEVVYPAGRGERCCRNKRASRHLARPVAGCRFAGSSRPGGAR